MHIICHINTLYDIYFHSVAHNFNQSHLYNLKQSFSIYLEDIKTLEIPIICIAYHLNNNFSRHNLFPLCIYTIYLRYRCLYFYFWKIFIYLSTDMSRMYYCNKISRYIYFYFLCLYKTCKIIMWQLTHKIMHFCFLLTWMR